MNIFVLDCNPKKCAEYHCDKHVVKMILETAQMMCSILWLKGIKAPYKKTHAAHPCTLWLMESQENWIWLNEMVQALNDEYKYRYKHTKSHASFEVIQNLKMPKLPNAPRTKFAQAMPDIYKNNRSAVTAYRAYYLEEKREICTWTRREMPLWFSKALEAG
jgi:hypothetical protein